jgi:hypothetical protein
VDRLADHLGTEPPEITQRHGHAAGRLLRVADALDEVQADWRDEACLSRRWVTSAQSATRRDVQKP